MFDIFKIKMTYNKYCVLCSISFAHPKNFTEKKIDCFTEKTVIA